MVNVLIIGAGEIGTAIGEVMSAAGMTVGYRDIDATKNLGPDKDIDFLHVCFGFTEKYSFLQTVGQCTSMYKPKIVVIDSTIPVGITRKLHDWTVEKWTDYRPGFAHSPVRGRHYDLVKQIKMYKKYVGAIDEKVGREVAAHFWRAGIPSTFVGKPEITELGKLLDTTYYGTVLAMHQEYERLKKPQV